MHLCPRLVPQSLELPECARRRDCLQLAPALAHTCLRVPTGSYLEQSALHPLLHLQKLLLHPQLQNHLLSRLLSPCLRLQRRRLLWRLWTMTMTLRTTTQCYKPPKRGLFLSLGYFFPFSYHLSHRLFLCLMYHHLTFPVPALLSSLVPCSRVSHDDSHASL